MSQKIPSNASVASALTGEKLHAPSAARNQDALCDMLRTHAPERGEALEIASGTGQHIVAFAQAFPKIVWAPTDVEEQRLLSINAYAADTSATNLRPAQFLDATVAGWHVKHGDKALVLLSNLLHLINDDQAQTIVTEAVMSLAPQGHFILYGPFKRDGKLTSEGDASFDADLRGADPAIGYKDDRQITEWLRAAGAISARCLDMPANNLAFVAIKS